MILDHDSCVIYSNQKAKDVLESTTVLGLDAFNRLKTSNQDQITLNKYILSALFQETTVQPTLPVGGVLGLTENETITLMLSIVPVSKLAHMSESIVQGQKVAIFLTESNQYHYLAKVYLKQVYKLSKRELDICEYFVNGLDLKEIAVQCGITYASVRTYFKYIFEKTKCCSQTELMRLLLSMTVDFEHIL